MLQKPSGDARNNTIKASNNRQDPWLKLEDPCSRLSSRTEDIHLRERDNLVSTRAAIATSAARRTTKGYAGSEVNRTNRNKEMNGFRPASAWVKGIDGRGQTCWCNAYTGHVEHSDPERNGLAIGPPPNANLLIDNNNTGNESPWETYFDLKFNHSYWYNRVTNETTWKDPKEPAKQQPAPPNVEKKEQDQWVKIKDAQKGKVWYNGETEKYQKERPDCLKKYK